MASQRLQHRKYWGSRQQLLAGKVISDWIDPEGGPMDPIFGVILQPTAGICFFIKENPEFLVKKAYTHRVCRIGERSAF